MSEVKKKAEEAREAALKLAILTSEQKDNVLVSIAEALWRERELIQEANKIDVAKASDPASEKIPKALIKRLEMNESKIREVVDMVRGIATLDDPVGRTEYAKELDEGLELYRVSSPIGVVGVIFESRPDALVQIASLCLKSGNAVILKGGSEASNSNRAIYNVIKEAAGKAGAPVGWIQQLEARAEVADLLEQYELVDLIIPRGSNEFVRYIQENTKIPVLGHSDGVCHIYVDVNAKVDGAVRVCLDAKIQYPSVCNAVDTLLVHREIAGRFLPRMMDEFDRTGVEVRGCKSSAKILGDRVKMASDDDWGKEYLDLIVSIRVVDGLEEATHHVNLYGSHHTDAIITEDGVAALRFMEEVDSASVLWNASTRFADGYRYGLGAEVGISTGKLHARGPTGLEGLTIYKYHLVGSHQTVSQYAGSDPRKYTHKPISGTWKDAKRRIKDSH